MSPPRVSQARRGAWDQNPSLTPPDRLRACPGCPGEVLGLYKSCPLVPVLAPLGLRDPKC